MSKIELACIIEDSSVNIFWMETIMEDVDFCDRILIYKNGREAINALKPIIASGKKLPEIIFLDLNMPVMDGWQFLDEFTIIPIEQIVTIYIVTSSINPADRARAAEYEKVSKFIVKPVEAEELREILNQF
jgi:CheY-like chemotaxis protein